MFLEVSEDNPGCPLFRVKVVELQSFFGMNIVYLFLELVVKGSQDVVEELHPVECEKLNFLRNFRVNGLPEEFYAEEEDFRVIIVFLDQIYDLGEHYFEDLVEKMFFIWLNRKLESCGYCD